MAGSNQMRHRHNLWGFARHAFVALVLLAVTACEDEEAARQQLQAQLQIRAAEIESQLLATDEEQGTAQGPLVVQLAFGAEADLDLYVTGPLLETVYFANKESKSGGKIVRDLRCESNSLKIEEVRFELPPGGRYRIGIDYPDHCGANGDTSRAAFSLRVTHNGKQQTLSGSVGYRFYEVAVMDFDIDPDNNLVGVPLEKGI